MNQSELFAGKIMDLIRRSDSGRGMAFSSFLTAEEAAEAERICRREHVLFVLYGGYDDAERQILGISDMERDFLIPCFPLVLMRVVGAEVSLLTNRDVLGALMGAGIRREVLGDIIARKGEVYIFAMDHMANYLIQNITEIGRYRVKLEECPLDSPLPSLEFDVQRFTVPSLRVDAVVSSLSRTSREKSSELINGKLVYLNHSLVEKKTKEIQKGDSIVVRGHGKWIVDECDSMTKKGRIVLICRKYV